MKYFKHYILISSALYFNFFGIFNISYAATLEPTSSEPSELAANYLRWLNPGMHIPTLATRQEAFDCVCNSIITEIPTGAVTHSGSGLTYGKSFTAKNQAPVDFTASLLTGRGSWCRDGIEGTDTNIADVGCGLGLSAVSLMSRVISTYTEGGWCLGHPIHFDLYDINPAHQPALQALATLVNTAYPEYFHVTATCHDVTNFLELDHYHVVLALNVMHYVPQTRWGEAIQSLEYSMKPGAMLLMTTDYAETPETGSAFFAYAFSVYDTKKRLETLVRD